MWWLKGDSWEEGDAAGSGESASGGNLSISSSGNDGAMDANQLGIAEMKDQFEQQQQLIHQLKELVRENEQQLRHKESALQESAAKLSKLKLQHKAKLTQMTGNKSQQRRSSASSTASASAEPTEDENVAVDQTSTAPTDSSRGKVLMLKRQMEENKAKFEKREKALKDNKRAIEQVLDDLKVQLEDRDGQIAELKSTQEAIAMANEAKSDQQTNEPMTPAEQSKQEESSVQEMYAQMVYKDSRILELNNQILELEASVMDLQENLKEKDGVIQARNKAIQLMTDDLSRRGKVVVDQLDDTRDEMRIMQHNFSTLENEWKAEKLRLEEELNVVRDQRDKQAANHNIQMADVRNANANLESARFDLSARNAALQEKLVHLGEELQKMKTKSDVDVVAPQTDYEEKIKSLTEQIQERDSKIAKLQQQHQLASSETGQSAEEKNIIKLKAQHKSKIKALEGQIKELEKTDLEMQEKCSSQDKILELEEEKGRNSETIEELKEQLRKQSDELSDHVKIVSTLQTEKLNLVEAIQIQQELTQRASEDRQALEDAKVRLEMRLVEAEELKDVADTACLELRRECELLTARLENSERPVLDVENRNDVLEEDAARMKLEIDRLRDVLADVESARRRGNETKELQLQEATDKFERLEDAAARNLAEAQTALQKTESELESKSAAVNALEVDHHDLQVNFGLLQTNLRETMAARDKAVDEAERALQSQESGHRETVDRLDAELKDLHGRLSEAKESNERLQAAIGEKDEELLVKDEEIAHLASEIADKDSQARDLSEKKDKADTKLEEKVTSLVSQLSELEAEVGYLQEQLADERARTEALTVQRQNDALESDEKIKSTIREMSDKCERDALSYAAEANERMQKELASKIEEINLMASENESAKNKVADLQRTLQDTDERIVQLLDHENHQVSVIHHLQTQLDAAEIEVKAVTSELQSAMNDVERSSQQNTAFEDEVSNLKLTLAQMHEEIVNEKQELLCRIEELNVTNNNHVVTISSMQDALRNAEAARDEAHANKTSIEQQHVVKDEQQQREIESLRESVTRLSTAIDDATKSESESTSVDLIEVQSRLKDALEDLESLRAQKDECASDYDEQSRKLNETLRSNEQLLEDSTHEQERMRTEMVALISQKQNLEARVAQLENEMEMAALKSADAAGSMHGTVGKLEAEKAEMEKVLADLQTSIDELQEKWPEAKIKSDDEIDRLKDENSTLTQEVDQLGLNLASEKNDMDAKLTNARIQIAELVTKLDNLQGERDMFSFQNTELHNEVANERQLALSFKENLESKDKENDNLKSKLGQLQEELQVCQCIYQGLESSMAELNEANMEQTGKIVRMTEETRLLNETILDLNEALDIAKSEVSEKNALILDKESRLESMAREMQEESKNDAKILQDRYQTMEKQWEEDLKTLEGENAWLRREIDSRKLDLDAAQHKISFLEGQLDDVQFALKEVVSENAELKESDERVRLVETQAELKSELAELRGAIEAARNDNQGLQELLSAAEKQLSDHQTSNAELQSRIQTMEESQSTKDLQEENQRLQEQISKLNESRSKLDDALLQSSSASPMSAVNVEQSGESQQALRNQLAVFRIKNEKMLIKLKQFKDKNDKMHLQINDLMSTQVNLEDSNVRLREFNERATEDIRRLTFDLRNVETLRKSDVRSLNERLETMETANGKLVDIKEELENQLTSKMQEYQKEKSGLEEMVNHLKSEAESSKNEQKEMFEQLRNKNASLQRQLESLRKHNEFLESDNREFQEILAANKTAKSAFEQEIRNQSERFVLVAQENAKLKEQMIEVGASISPDVDLRDNYDRLSVEFEELQTIRLKLLAQVDVLTVERDNLARHKSDIESEVEKQALFFEERIRKQTTSFEEELQKQAMSFEERLRQEEDLKAGGFKSWKDAQVQVEMPETPNSDMEESVGRLKTELRNERMQTAALLRTVSSLEGEISRMTEEMNHLTDVVSSKEAECRRELEQRAELTHNLATQSSVADGLRREKQQAQTEYQLVFEEQRKTIDALEKQIIFLAASNSSSGSGAETRDKLLEDELYRVKNDLGKGMLQLKEEMERASFLESENDHLKSSLETLRNGSDRMEAELLAYRADIRNLQDENAAMEQQLSNWKKHLGSVVNESQQLTESASAAAAAPPPPSSDGNAYERLEMADDGSHRLEDENGRLKSRLQSLDAELQRSMQSLHLRDLRCEEFSSTITKLIEERDSLQLRLSSSIRSDQTKEMKIELLQQELSAKSPTPTVASYSTGGESHHSDYEALNSRLEQKYQELLHLNAVLEQSLISEKEIRLKAMADLKMANEELLALEGRRHTSNDETRISVMDDIDTSPLMPEHSQTLIRSYTGAAWRIANWIQGRSTPRVMHV